MIPYIVIGGYLGVGLIIFWGAAFFPPVNGGRHKKVDLMAYSFGWPTFLVILLVIAPPAGLATLHDFITDRMIARRKNKELQSQQAKQLPAAIDVMIEEKPTNYRTAACQGCGRPLQ